jgi:hypothetical protein
LSAKSSSALSITDDRQFFRELVEGLVHGFPLCCVVEYCSDIYFGKTTSQAKERGVAFFRTFSLYASENLFNELDHVWAADHFVPCQKCRERLAKMGNLDFLS